jgi:hypothetical protein
MTPAITAVWLPRRVTGSMPAFSKACQAVSSSSRCCGSVASASRGLMPKNSASKRAASYRNPPSRA